MSKSLNNFTTIRSLLDGGVEAMVLRLFVLQAHYRKPIDLTDAAIASAQNAWATLQEGLLFGYRHGQALGWTDVDDTFFGDPTAMRIEQDHPAVLQFQEVMDDDFNTSAALAVLFELAKDLQKESNRLVHEGKAVESPDSLRQSWQILVVLAAVLGLQASPEAVEPTSGLSDAEIEARIQERLAARKAKNFAEGDRIRDQLKAQGIILVDKPGGITEWHRG